MAIDEPQSKTEPTPSSVINTSGGTYVAGNVDTRGGTFIGRDLIVKIGIPLALTLVIGIAMLVVAVNQGWIFASQIRPIVDPYSVEQAQMPAGRFNIAVAPFDVSAAQGDPANLQVLSDEVSGWMAERLNKGLQAEQVTDSLQSAVVWANKLLDMPAIKPPIAPIKIQADAEFWQKRLGARLIIYGKLSGTPQDTTLQPSFYYRSDRVSELPDLDSGHHPFGGPVKIEFADDVDTALEHLQLKSDLSQRAEAFVWLITALTQVSANAPDAALATLRSAEQHMQGWNHPQLASILYYYMGSTALQVPDLAEAKRAFTQVRDPQTPLGTPLAAMATIGLGNYHFLAAQGFFAPQQAQVPGLAQCAAAFSGGQTGATERNAGEIPTDLAGVFAALQSAQRLYQDAVQWLEQHDPQQQDPEMQHIKAVAEVMSANAQRLDGESAIYGLAAPDLTDADRTALLEKARRALDTAIANYQQVAGRFEQMQRYSVQAYALHGLGLAQKARAAIDLDYLDNTDQATTLYKQASDNLAHCIDLGDRPDRDGYVSLQQRMRCFCEIEKQAVDDTLGELQ
jgi:hypothetical protein